MAGDDTKPRDSESEAAPEDRERAAQEARAKRLREQIERIRKSSKEDPASGEADAGRPESPREFIDRKMREREAGESE